MAECVPGRSLSDNIKSGKMCDDSRKLKTYQQLHDSDMLKINDSKCWCEVCPKHEGEVMRFYCKTHDTIACTFCVVQEHRQCDNICTLAEIVNVAECSDKYKVLCDAIEDLKLDLSDQIEGINESKRIVILDREKAVSKIDEFQIKILQKLQLLRLQVEKEAKEIERKETVKLNEVLTTANKVMELVEDLDKEMKDHEEMNQCQHQFIAVKKAEEELGDLKKMSKNLKTRNKLERFSFVENDVLSKMIQKVEKFGELQTCNADKSNQRLQSLLVHLYR
ncbi:tripartite motif-containing protein 2-like [Ruditapes philippinarum]|uniref:tripartite motif-containing protein 2-like n=1 Tax=Ruditapes philippinarum TaxID=129788 RepID=UPI00295A6CA7|nr:tripartite motif-containing protein 2-like [Ruditapes philippinarum]